VQGGDTQTVLLALHMSLLRRTCGSAAERLVKKIEATTACWHGISGDALSAGRTDQAGSGFGLSSAPEYDVSIVGLHGGARRDDDVGALEGDQMRGDPSMNSYNHYAYGAVADWIYRYAAGVDATPLDAGFHTVVLHPQFDARLGRLRSITSRHTARFIRIGRKGRPRVACDAACQHDRVAALSADETGNYKLDGVSIAESELAKAGTRGGQSGFELHGELLVCRAA